MGKNKNFFAYGKTLHDDLAAASKAGQRAQQLRGLTNVSPVDHGGPRDEDITGTGSACTIKHHEVAVVVKRLDRRDGVERSSEVERNVQVVVMRARASVMHKSTGARSVPQQATQELHSIHVMIQNLEAVTIDDVGAQQILLLIDLTAERRSTEDSEDEVITKDGARSSVGATKRHRHSSTTSGDRVAEISKSVENNSDSDKLSRTNLTDDDRITTGIASGDTFHLQAQIQMLEMHLIALPIYRRRVSDGGPDVAETECVGRVETSVEDVAVEGNNWLGANWVTAKAGVLDAGSI